VTAILVIRLGALGDFVLSFPAFAAIRAHHPAAEITLLTTAPFAALAEAAPWFDRVLIDRKPAWWNLPALRRLSRGLRGFAMVYDLQTSGRSSRYFRLAGRPPWSGIARGCAYPHANPARETMHTLERQRDQLEMAGIAAFPAPDLAWLGTAAALPQPYALLVPGAAAHRPQKRWPVARYAELAGILAARGITPVVIGAAAERPLAAAIQAACPTARDRTGQTSIPDIPALAARATVAIGNDTGPMHLAAAAGCPCVVLFSGASDPALTAPRGPGGSWPRLLRVENLSDLSVAGVVEALA
jgi:ADP-heptose:LPS heptosyltransferase